MKNNWTIISISTGILAGLLSHLIVKDWRVNLFIAVVVIVGMLINNPQKRFMRAFWVLLSMFLVLNRFFFKIVGSISEIDFEFGSNEIHWIVSIALLILAGISLRLDFLERNGIKVRLRSFFQIRINSPNVKGNYIKQGDNSTVNIIERDEKKEAILNEITTLKNHFISYENELDVFNKFGLNRIAIDSKELVFREFERCFFNKNLPMNPYKNGFMAQRGTDYKNFNLLSAEEWRNYMLKRIPLNTTYKEELNKIDSFANSPFLPDKIKSSIEKFKRTLNENIQIIGLNASNFGRELDGKYIELGKRKFTPQTVLYNYNGNKILNLSIVVQEILNEINEYMKK